MKREEGYVLLPQPIEEEAHELLRARGLPTLTAGDPKVETVLPLLKGARAVVLRTGIRFTGELIAEADSLLHISRTGAGVDNVDLEAATERGVVVTSSVGVNTGSVVEHAFALMLALFKRLPLLDREVRGGNFGVRYRNLPRDLRRKRLGVVGFGRIGASFAGLCRKAFDMEVLAFDPHLDDRSRKGAASWVEFTSLEELFRRADVVSVHIPLTAETKGMIGMKCLKLMKPDAFVINTSRGGVIEEGDLARALEAKLIAGAGLDVFEKEPPDERNPLLAAENAILTPHTAALTRECVLEMAVKAVERIIDLFDGYVPDNVANLSVLDQEKWRGLRKKGPAGP